MNVRLLEQGPAHSKHSKYELLFTVCYDSFITASPVRCALNAARAALDT